MKKSRRSNLIVALLATVVVLLWRGTRQQRRIMRLLTGAMFANWASDALSNPIGWFRDRGGDLVQFVVDSIQVVYEWALGWIDWLRSLITDAVNLVWALFGIVTTLVNAVRDTLTNLAWWLYYQAVNIAHILVDGAVNFARGLFDMAVGLIHALVDAVTNLAWWLFNMAVTIAQQLVEALRSFVVGLFDMLRNLIDAAVSGLRALIEGVFSTLVNLVHAVVDAAVSALRAAIDAAVSALRAAIDAAVSGLRAAIDAAVSGVRAFVDTVLAPVTEFLFGTVRTIVDVVSTVLDWLVALAQFPFTTGREMWAAMRRTGGLSVIEHMTGAVDRWGDHVLGSSVAYTTLRDKPYDLPPLPDPYGGGGSGAGNRLVFATVKAFALGVGLDDRAADIAAAIAMAESGGNTNAHNPVPPDDSYGLWQINMIGELGPARRARFGLVSNTQLFDPHINALAMFDISAGGTNWSPWTTYTSGAYRRFLP